VKLEINFAGERAGPAGNAKQFAFIIDYVLPNTAVITERAVS